MDKANNLRDALQKIGVNTVEQLNDAVKEQKALNIGIMAGQITQTEERGIA